MLARREFAEEFGLAGTESRLPRSRRRPAARRQVADGIGGGVGTSMPTSCTATPLSSSGRRDRDGCKHSPRSTGPPGSPRRARAESSSRARCIPRTPGRRCGRYWAVMTWYPPARHLLRARDFADSRYFEHVGVADLARAARLSPAHFSRAVHAARSASRRTSSAQTRRLERAAALLRKHRPQRGRRLPSTSDCRASARSPRASGECTGMSPTTYRASRLPPASAHARVPACVVRALQPSATTACLEKTKRPARLIP